MYPGWVIWKEVWLEMMYGPWIRELELFWVGNRDCESLGGDNGGLVGQSEKVCRLIKWTDHGLVNVQIGCWTGLADGRILRDVKNKAVVSYEPRRLS